jgi:broad specificity phosphatase PhoE
MSTIYLIRHGENHANITKEFSYKYVDYSLTPKGVLQAKQTAAYLRDKNITDLYASPLKRAIETADIISSVLHLPVTIMEQFRELNVGLLEGQPPSAHNWAIYMQIVNAWYAGCHDLSFPGGEDYVTLRNRMMNGLQEILRNQAGTRVALIGHGGMFTATLKDICLHVDLNTLLQRKKQNCSITEIEAHLVDGRVDGKLKAWASCSHLQGEAAQFFSGSPLFEDEMVHVASPTISLSPPLLS